MHFHAGVHATESRGSGKKTRSEVQTNVTPQGPYGAPLKIHRSEDSQQRRRCCPFVAIERVLFPDSRFLLGNTPSCLSTPLLFRIRKLHAAARPGVMRFYESQSGLLTLDLLRSAFLFVFQRQWLPSTREASRSNNVVTSIQTLVLKENNNNTSQNSFKDSKLCWILQETIKIFNTESNSLMKFVK